MPKYTVKSPVKHDGKRYGVGEKITLKVEDAERLLANGAVEDDRDSAADRKAAEKAAAERKAAEEAERKATEEAERKAAEEADAAVQAEAARKAAEESAPKPD